VAEAIKKSPEKYQNYISAGRKAARTLKSIYAEDTKFTLEPIKDEELMPHFP